MTSTTLPPSFATRARAFGPKTIALHRPAWRVAGAALASSLARALAKTLATGAQRWQRWRAERQHEQQLRGLQALDPRLLKDVGLGEFAETAAVPSVHRWRDASW